MLTMKFFRKKKHILRNKFKKCLFFGKRKNIKIYLRIINSIIIYYYNNINLVFVRFFLCKSCIKFHLTYLIYHQIETVFFNRNSGKSHLVYYEKLKRVNSLYLSISEFFFIRIVLLAINVLFYFSLTNTKAHKTQKRGIYKY